MKTDRKVIWQKATCGVVNGMKHIVIKDTTTIIISLAQNIEMKRSRFRRNRRIPTTCCRNNDSSRVVSVEKTEEGFENFHWCICVRSPRVKNGDLEDCQSAGIQDN